MSTWARWGAIDDGQGTAWPVALSYLAALALAEVLTALVEPRLGLVLHGLLLVTLLLHAALNWGRPARALLLSIAFAPLIRLLSLSLPLAGIPLLHWYLVTSIPLFMAARIAMRTLGISWSGAGVNLRAWPLQLMVGLVGAVFGLVEYHILRPTPLVRSFTLDQLWLPALILLLSTGFMEELVFRGLMQPAARQALGGQHIMYVSALFAVLHVGYRSLLDMVFVFGVALFFGYVVERTESILGVSLAHGVTNVVLYLVAPFVL